MNSVIVKNLMRNTLQAYSNYFGSKHYRSKILPTPVEIIWCQNMVIRYLKRSKKEYKNVCGQPTYFIYLPTDNYRNTVET